MQFPIWESAVKINLLLLAIGLAPPLAALFVLRTAGVVLFQNILALYIATFLVLYYPLAKLMEELIVLRQTRRINKYVEEIKAGRGAPDFELPEEKGDEHDFLRLRRNIFWMVQGLITREARLKDILRKLDHARRQVLESIEYASLIQRCFLPSETDLAEAMGDYFLLWRPRDGVGGDAYWIRRTPDHTMVAVFDCTGHGVPGAFLSLIVYSLFEQNYDDACRNDPGLLLSRLNRAVKQALSQHDTGDLSDGMEGSVCCVDRRTNIMHFAGARSHMFIGNHEGIREIKGDRQGVGFAGVPDDRKFTNHSISLRGVDAAYLFTDGITDQIGGQKRLPWGRHRIREWLQSHQDLSMADQQRGLEQAFAEYMGKIDQRDDVTVLGFSIREFVC